MREPPGYTSGKTTKVLLVDKNPTIILETLPKIDNQKTTYVEDPLE
jgi:hypothetical protein